MQLKETSSLVSLIVFKNFFESTIVLHIDLQALGISFQKSFILYCEFHEMF